jgi:hypothetical protein
MNHELDVPKSAGLVLGEHRTGHRAGRVQQQAAFVPGDQRASPQVSADEPRRPIVLVESVPLVPQRHDVNGPAGTEGAERREDSGQRPITFLGTGRARGRGPPRREGGRSAAHRTRPGRDNGRTARRTYMISNPRAGRRLGENQLLTASRGPAAACLPAICSSPAASPSRASTAARPTQSRAARARERAGAGAERAGDRGHTASRSGSAGGHRGRPQGVARRGAGLQPRVDSADHSPFSAAPPWRGNCRLLRLLLPLLLPLLPPLLLLAKWGGKK